MSDVKVEVEVCLGRCPVHTRRYMNDTMREAQPHAHDTIYGRWERQRMTHGECTLNTIIALHAGFFFYKKERIKT